MVLCIFMYLQKDTFGSRLRMETGQDGPLYISRLVLSPLSYKDTGEFACVDNDSASRSSVYVFIYGKTFD